jgi:hypothetical protein
MKLNEIKHSYHKIKGDGEAFRQNLGVRSLEKFYSGPNATPDPQPKNRLVKVLGHGAYSTAVHGRDPNVVMKISRGTRDLNDDPYYLYLSRIAAAKTINPFLPRVYEVKVYETSNRFSPYFYIAKMERLHSLHTLTDRELIEMILALTKAKMTVSFKQALGITSGEEVLKKQSRGELIEILISKIRREKIKNPQLKAAMNLAASTGMEWDITSHNLMVRHTDEGPQLVLADPVRN